MNTEIFYKKPLLVIYVPGYLSGEDKQKEVKDKLAQLYPDSPITIFNWDSVASYSMALHNSIQASSDLIQYLKDLPCGNNVVLIGHSLGALVVARAMRKIPFNSYYGAKQVVLLGAAIDAITDLRHMCEVTEYPVINVINNNDLVLNTAYSIFSCCPALGSHGGYCKHTNNYVELEILQKEPNITKADSVHELANQVLDATGHSASRVYLDSLIRGTYIVNS